MFTSASFHSKQDKQPKPFYFENLTDFHQWLSSACIPVANKEAQPLWSPVTYKPSTLRGDDNIDRLWALVLDYDHITRDALDRVLATLAERGWFYILHSTWNHGRTHAEKSDLDGPPPSADALASEPRWCFRIVLPGSRLWTREEHTALYPAAVAALGAKTDTTCRNPSRLFYVPGFRPQVAGLPFELGGPLIHCAGTTLCNVDEMGSKPVSMADVDSVEESHALEEWPIVLSVAPEQKYKLLLKASYAFACKAHENHEPREVAEQRVTLQLRDALMMNVNSPVESWPAALKNISGGFDLAYARPAPPRVVAPAPVPLAGFEIEFNEDGLARRFARLYGPRALGPRACFVPGQGWRAWDGKRWAEQPGNGRPTELVSEMLISLHEEVVKTDEKLAGTVKAKKTAGTMGSILTLAQRYMSVPFEAFDSDPLLLNCPNGTVDLRTGQLRPHNPADLISRCSGVAFDPTARCDRWLHALGQMQNNDRDTIQYMHLLFGSFLQGSAIDGLWILHGNGFDGKSTVLQVLHGVMGDYARAMNAQAITVSRNGSKAHTSMIGSIIGARLVTIDEMPADCQLDTGAIKSYFGRLPVRLQTGMGKDFVDARPTAKGLIASNHLPRIDEQDEGTKRRIAVVPFDANLREKVVKDDSFPARLVQQEGPAILAWLVSGCLAWFSKQGLLPTCVRIERATEALFGEGDTVGRFLQACPRAMNGLKCTASQLYLSFVAFATAEGDYVCSKRAFGNRVREQGTLPARGTGGVREYAGISWPVDFPPAQPPTKKLG